MHVAPCTKLSSPMHWSRTYIISHLYESSERQTCRRLLAVIYESTEYLHCPQKACTMQHSKVTSFKRLVSRADCECGYYRTGCPTAFVGSQCSSLIGRYPGRRFARRETQAKPQVKGFCARHNSVHCACCTGHTVCCLLSELQSSELSRSAVSFIVSSKSEVEINMWVTLSK